MQSHRSSLGQSAILHLALTSLAGCVCGYETPVATSQRSGSPRCSPKVMDAFCARFPKDKVTRVEQITFSGRNVSYQIHFVQTDGCARVAGVQKTGEVVIFSENAGLLRQP